MKIIVGLGNPDKKYLTTRHNIGFIIVDKLVEKLKISFKLQSRFNALIAEGLINDEKVLLVKPLTYMNLSGQSVIKILNYYNANQKDLLVISDDITLAVGQIRLREAGGHGGHNGLRSIIEYISPQYKRLRFGIDQNKNVPLEVYVLSNFNKTEIEEVKVGINNSLEAIEFWLTGAPFENVMSKYNSKV